MKFYMAVKYNAYEFCEIIWESVHDMINRKNKAHKFLYQVEVYKKITYKGNSYQIMEGVCDAEAETLKNRYQSMKCQLS